MYNDYCFKYPSLEEDLRAALTRDDPSLPHRWHEELQPLGKQSDGVSWNTRLRLSNISVQVQFGLKRTAIGRPSAVLRPSSSTIFSTVYTTQPSSEWSCWCGGACATWRVCDCRYYTGGKVCVISHISVNPFMTQQWNSREQEEVTKTTPILQMFLQIFSPWPTV